MAPVLLRIGALRASTARRGRSRRAMASSSLAGLLLLAGCSDTLPPTGPSAPDPSASGAPLAQIYQRPHEARFQNLSREIPAFGGYFYDQNGDLVVYLTDPAQAAAARAAIAPLLAEKRLSAHQQPTAPDIVVREARYTFLQLAAWRDRMTDEVLSLAGVVFTDLDEARNRLAVGLESEAARAEAERTLASLGIPLEAVVLEVAGPIIMEATLRDYIRPVEGGLQIQMKTTGGTLLGTCTFGFNARWNNTDVFLTNSHCTEKLWASDWTYMYQPSASYDSYYIGREDYDPAPFRCGPFYDRNDCRYSDAAIILHQTTNFNYGYIARTTYYAYGRGSVGSIEIDSSNPRMQITAEDPAPAVGEYMDKMGRTTGWTYGEVSKTCVDVESGDIMRLCQDFAKYGSDKGDSGSPVFIWHGSTVTLQGIHWGSTGDGANAIFSAMANIEYDLGSMSVF